MVDLEALKSEIECVGNQIRDLKAGGSGDVGALVGKLNGLKKDYADNNGGIGVDGKPYQVPLSKAEKKKLEKEKKAAPASGAVATAAAASNEPVRASKRNEEGR